MPDVLKIHADGSPDRLAVIVDASHGAKFSTTTYAELNPIVNRLAHGLLALGARAGDRIVWCGPNSLETIAVIHAARKAGLVAVPLSYRFTAEEMAYVIDNSDATLVVADADYAPLIASVRDEIPKVQALVGFCARSSARRCPTGFRRGTTSSPASPTTSPVAVDASAVGAQMLYTSGTTGKPKGALRTTTERADRVRAARRARLPDGQRGAPHHRAAVPLGSARVRVAEPPAGRARSWCCAGSTRRRGSRP